MQTVLVVDDDTDLLDMVNLVLTSHELNVTCISKGSLLLESIEGSRPDLILMDVFLGDSDGRDLCLSLKTSGKYTNIPVILYSAGFITASSIKASMANDFMVKPFDISRLVDKIRGMIDEQ